MKNYFSDRMKKTRKNIVKYILELLIVAFGVFLGIYVGERNHQKKTDLNTRNAIVQIISELDSNVKRLGSAIRYHEQIGVELDSVRKSLKQSDFNSIYFNNKKFNHNNLPSWTGVGVVRLSKSIYESAKIGGVFQELNISTINLISSIYEYQEIYDEFSMATVDKMLEMDSETKTSDVIQLLSRLSKHDIIKIEKGLLNQINKNIVELERKIENKSFKK
ncbi:hypothetical protein [Tenacibaculum caenipelagi]|uniref:Uncharacterized protein n=1 Tax=Tenacibaculum caenipelagi TaxID=1325435 RepID=A0A4R6TGW0_9FLAO|nr:hypothetical protein [Tenacibaculum caenipelagi]TDQ27532.1 hypothetical protein DFQ07_1383 [Tenacibaculum caenipelagi]